MTNKYQQLLMIVGEISCLMHINKKASVVSQTTEAGIIERPPATKQKTTETIILETECSQYIKLSGLINTRNFFNTGSGGVGIFSIKENSHDSSRRKCIKKF